MSKGTLFTIVALHGLKCPSPIHPTQLGEPDKINPQRLDNLCIYLFNVHSKISVQASFATVIKKLLSQTLCVIIYAPYMLSNIFFNSNIDAATSIYMHRATVWGHFICDEIWAPNMSKIGATMNYLIWIHALHSCWYIIFILISRLISRSS